MVCAMRKAGVLSILFLVVLLAVAVIAEAQQAKKVPRIGYLAAACPDTQSARTEAFRQGLRDLGYIEGLKLDLIVTAGNEATQAAKNATGTIPLVTTGSDPVVSGFVANLAHPGGNITGVSIDAPGLSGKRLDLLKESFPRLSRVAVLYYPATPSSKVTMAETEQAARLLKVHLQPVGVETSDELENAFSAMIKGLAEALIKLPSAVLTSYRKRIVELAAKSRLPAMYEDRIIAENGGLMSYGPDITDLYRRAATYVDKILKGVKPGDLPVEQPTKFEFIINLKAAKQIGLTIPPNVLVRADKVIK
jgi:putative ABC transport system substrate-binding protein